MKSKIWLALGLIFVVSSLVWAQTAKKTVTNEDLEKFKQKRLQSEAEYRAKYKELGMPSPEELERRNAEDRRWHEEFSRQTEANKQQSQDYWQSRAGALRNEIYSINAQINYLNNQIAGLSKQNPIFVTPQQLSQNPVVSYGYFPGGFRQGFHRPQINTVNPATSVQTAINAAAANPNPFYGTPLYQTGIKLVIGQSNVNYGRRGGYHRNFGYGGYVPYVANNNYSSNKDELILRLQYLGQARAGLFAQWNYLVDEAHRAGVKVTF